MSNYIMTMATALRCLVGAEIIEQLCGTFIGEERQKRGVREKSLNVVMECSEVFSNSTILIAVRHLSSCGYHIKVVVDATSLILLSLCHVGSLNGMLADIFKSRD